jgi:hypothetical protein
MNLLIIYGAIEDGSMSGRKSMERYWIERKRNKKELIGFDQLSIKLVKSAVVIVSSFYLID